jgi:hypothetical protein
MAGMNILGASHIGGEIFEYDNKTVKNYILFAVFVFFSILFSSLTIAVFSATLIAAGVV